MAPIGFSDSQLDHVTAAAQQIPPFQRGRFLRRIVNLLRGKSFGDAEVHRAAQAAAQEVRRNRPGRARGCVFPKAPTRRQAGRSPGAVSDEIRDGRKPQDRHGGRP